MSFTVERKDRAARIYLERRTKILEWIRDCFDKYGEPLNRDCDDLIELVADGTVLCKLFNLYFPNSIEKIVYPNGKFFYHRIQNISEFIRQCQIIKVPIIFQTLDLFENKNPARVVACLYCLIEMLDDKIARRRLKRKKEFTIEEMARAHLELEVDQAATEVPISEYLFDSLPIDINSQPTIQFQVSSSNTYDSNNLSVLDSSHTRATVINTPRILTSSTLNTSTLNTSALYTPMNNNNQNNSNNNTSSILNTPLVTPISNHNHHDEMATMTAIKTAAVMTSPVRRSSSSFSSNLLDNHLNNTILSPYRFNGSNSIISNHHHSNGSSTIKTSGEPTSPFKPLYPSLMKLNDIQNTSSTNLLSSRNSTSNHSISSSSLSNQKIASSSSVYTDSNKKVKHSYSIWKTLLISILFILFIIFWMVLFVENHDKLDVSSIFSIITNNSN